MSSTGAPTGVWCSRSLHPSVLVASLAYVGYRELPPPAPLRELVETAWVVDGPGDAVRVLPDGCMDLIRMHGRVVVAGVFDSMVVRTMHFVF